MMDDLSKAYLEKIPPAAFLVPFLFAVLATIFGLAYLFLIPPNQVPDEVLHFARSLSVASGHCIGQESVKVPPGVQQMSDTFPSAMDRIVPTRSISLDTYETWMMPARNHTAGTLNDYPATIYPCIPYLPSAAAVTLARMVSVPPLILYYFGRIANLLSFVGLGYAALRILPDFRVQLCGLALMPMTLSQAASYSADALTLGLSFLLTAYLLKLAFDENLTVVAPRHWITLGLLSICCALTKLNVWLELLVLLVPASKFLRARTRLLFVSTMLLLALVTAALWTHANLSNTEVFVHRLLQQRDIDLNGNASWLCHHPLLFLGDVAYMIAAFHGRYLTMFVGMLGWLSIPLPFSIVSGYSACLLLFAFTQTEYVSIASKQRLWLAGLFLLSFISVFVLLFNFEVHTPYIHRQPAGIGEIPGVQGRYFIPFALLLLLPFSNRKYQFNSSIAVGLLLIASTVANGTALRLVWKEFYNNGGSYNNGLAASLDGRIVQGDHGLTYFLVEGQLRRIRDDLTLTKLDVDSPKVTLTSSQVGSLHIGPDMPLIRSDLLLDEEPGGGVFYIYGGRRHGIPDPETLSALRVADPVVGVSPNVITSVPLGFPVPHMSLNQDECLRAPDGRAYLREKNQISLIPDADTLTILHFGFRERKAGRDELKSFKLMRPLPSLHSKLLIDRKLGEVFYVDGGVRHGIPDPATLHALHTSDPGVELPENEIVDIPEGSPLPHVD